MRKLLKKISVAFASIVMIFMMLPIMPKADTPKEDMTVIYAKVPADWSSPAAWAFDADGNNAFAAWPGEMMDADSQNSGWYYIYIPKKTNHVIINANKGSVQTKEQIVEGNSWITVNSADDVVVSKDQQTKGDIPAYVEKFKVHAKVDSSWTDPCMWAWNTDGTNAYAEWPGAAMAKGDDDWYTISVPKFCDHIIVNANQGKIQTKDIKIDPAELWVTVDAEGKNEISYVDPVKAAMPNIHVYVKAPADWKNPNLWAWSAPDGTNAFSAWPGEALEKGKDGWLTKEVPGWINSLIVNGNKGKIQTKDISVDAGKDVWLVVTGKDKNFKVYYKEPAEVKSTKTNVTSSKENSKTDNKMVPIILAVAAVVVIAGGAFALKKKNQTK